jgi:hypothetical protein
MLLKKDGLKGLVIFRYILLIFRVNDKEIDMESLEGWRETQEAANIEGKTKGTKKN